MKNLYERARKIIGERDYITIATVDDSGQPWNTPVYAAKDADHAFYWGSHIEAQHSRNIDTNPKIFIVIYDSTAPVGEGEGVYIRAIAEKITDSTEKDRALQCIKSQRPKWFWEREEFDEPTPLALYRAVPQMIWMNDEGSKDNHYIDVRTEIDLAILRAPDSH